ncbi:30S ribosomal protein S14 [Nocardioides nitrophenolicus]|uniref:30S ribosomal protein S14 n=1 Tax=Nocardioides nitrophenolicus TaxID=60489 RepID=UPI001957F1AB|nr:30S ribosomal protein S14 [Nocardioides nitrophenolicus]MBM7518047.1 small subunit ribosomal protein S14 [Nocardioides nitrophenolicus]
MASRAKIAADARRRVTVARYAGRRAALKERVRRAEPGSVELAAAVRELARLPRDASPVRLRNRDQVDGRPRGYLRKAGLSRIRFRELAHRGELPGVTKSSW